MLNARSMKTGFIFCSFSMLSISIVLTACSSIKNNRQSDILQSTYWQKDSLFVDGSDNDWAKPLSYFDEKQQVGYTISNDKNNLYILATTKDENNIQKILRGGLTVYINHHGVKEEAGAAGISFPTGNRIRKDNKLLNDRPELEQDKHIALNAVDDYALFGFQQVKTPENYNYGTSNPEGIILAVGLNTSGELVYEALVPLSSFLNRNELINLNRKSFAIGFVLESIPGQPRSRNGGLAIGAGIGLGSFGRGAGVGLSIGTGALTNIGGRKRNKPVKIWRELLLAKAPVTVK
jgi:hypothetical protein